MTGYADDPLLQARRTHHGEQRGHPDGLCCVGCEGPRDAMVGTHVLWPCPVIQVNRCEFEIGDLHCIQTGHDGDVHLVENRWGGRSVVSPA